MSDGATADNELEQVAVEQLLKETTKAAARAEVGGSLAWGRGNKPGVNRRFLNNTVLSTVYLNRKAGVTQVQPNLSHQQADIRSSFNLKATVDGRGRKVSGAGKLLGVTKAKAVSIRPKTVISNTSRFKACLQAYRQKKVQRNQQGETVEAAGDKQEKISESDEPPPPTPVDWRLVKK